MRGDRKKSELPFLLQRLRKSSPFKNTASASGLDEHDAPAGTPVWRGPVKKVVIHALRPSENIGRIRKKRQIMSARPGNNGRRLLAFCCIALAVTAVAESFTIPAESVDEQKIFWGNPAKFEKPASVDYKAIIMATEEYKSIKQNKIEAGTAKYWLLISQASEKAVKVIAEVGKNSEYDLVVAKGYLESLNIKAAPVDITAAVLERLQKGKSG